ncbi:hypothetical protein KR018_000309 [Drosophila ironensis]|nr:hypothetical protein KR018_000309 [Drosophila ironensis]
MSDDLFVTPFQVLATLTATSLAAPLQFSDVFAAFQPVDKQEVVKRQVTGNPDAELKQISFHGLIGDLEDSLFQSALSLHHASAPGSEVEEVKPQQAVNEEEEEHAITKRSDDSTPATPAASSTVSAADADALARKILLQTTKKVPGSEDGLPAHLIIDHVSVQPHNGGALPLIPTFQVHHTKLISATIKEDSNNDSSDGKQTKISITKTSITSTAPIESVEEAVALAAKEEASSTTAKEESTTKAAEKEESNSKSSESSEEDKKVTSTTILTIVSESSSNPTTTTNTSTTSTSSTTPSTTTEEPIQKLKKDEEKLKEKVAEVEAEPVILSSRV